MSKERISIDELLAEQSAPAPLLATVEKVQDKDDRVKVTPWTRAGGCKCHLALNIKKSSIEGATPTDDVHICCGKALKIVELHFTQNDNIALQDLFEQLAEAAKKSGSEHARRAVSHHSDDSHVTESRRTLQRWRAEIRRRTRYSAPPIRPIHPPRPDPFQPDPDYCNEKWKVNCYQRCSDFSDVGDRDLCACLCDTEYGLCVDPEHYLLPFCPE